MQYQKPIKKNKMKEFAIKEDGRINQRRIFKTPEEAQSELERITNDEFWKGIHSSAEVVECWTFALWYRRWNGEKDFIDFASDQPQIEDAVQEAIDHLSKSFAIHNPDFGIVARHGKMTQIFKDQLQNLKKC